MNNILEVKVRFNREKNTNRSFSKNLGSKSTVTSDKIESLIQDLRGILHYYQSVPKLVKNILIDVHHTTIIPKSKRLQVLLKPLRKNIDESIVGARFSDAPEGQEKHILTYYTDEKSITTAISLLQEAKKFIIEQLNGCAKADNFNEPKIQLSYDGYSSENNIRSVITESSVIDHFSIPNVTTDDVKDSFLLTFFQTECSPSDIFGKLNINQYSHGYSDYGKNTISVTRELYQILREKVPYLISMICTDLSSYSFPTDSGSFQKVERTIPAPVNEPVIGVIDNLFDESSYFNAWVENKDCLEDYEKNISIRKERDHGTEVSSIIVDGPSLNPWLDDGCGRFRVRHFGVCERTITIPRLVNKIKTIIENNTDIHVWNLSLGTIEEVPHSFISYDAAALDDLQTKYNILFVISGTNDEDPVKGKHIRLGSPADSLNAITVNSVNRDGTPASYSRKGPVLSFFNKPDVCYYGGDYKEGERIKAWSSRGLEEVYGTSFAAPWISRKLAFLIDIMGLPREVAKALIIDAAAAWDYKKDNYTQKDLLGYGIVPKRIEDILKTPNDEIKFILYGTAETYKTTNYAIPVPKDSENKYPFIARAALCYFPECSRSQGVDYTNRELSFKFGRINSKGTIDDINENSQDDEGSYVDERKARKEFRKWENTKFISKILKNNKSLKSYEDRMWGISIVSKERLSIYSKKGLNFGIVITLREINGINRIQDFITSCALRGWIVNEINLESRLELYHQNQQEIHFD